VRKVYTKKKNRERTSIAIDPLLTKRIDKILKNKEKLAEFAREAINLKLWDRERESITSLTATEQFHKIESMKKDIESLKWNVDHMNSELNGYRESIRRGEMFSRKVNKMMDRWDREKQKRNKH